MCLIEFEMDLADGREIKVVVDSVVPGCKAQLDGPPEYCHEGECDEINYRVFELEGEEIELGQWDSFVVERRIHKEFEDAAKEI